MEAPAGEARSRSPLSTFFSSSDADDVAARLLSGQGDDEPESAELRAVRELVDRRHRLEELSAFFSSSAEKLEHRMMVPLGKHAFISATMVRTNEVTMKAADGTLKRLSTKEAVDEIQRRIAAINEEIAQIQLKHAEAEATKERATQRYQARLLADVAKGFALADDAEEGDRATKQQTPRPHAAAAAAAGPSYSSSSSSGLGRVEQLPAEDGNTYSYVTEFEQGDDNNKTSAKAKTKGKEDKKKQTPQQQGGSGGGGLTIKWRASTIGHLPPKGLTNVEVVDAGDDKDSDGQSSAGSMSALQKRLQAAKEAKAEGNNGTGKSSSSLSALISAVDAYSSSSKALSEEDEFETAAEATTPAAAKGSGSSSGFSSGFLNKAASSSSSSPKKSSEKAAAVPAPAASGSRVAFAEPSRNQTRHFESARPVAAVAAADRDSNGDYDDNEEAVEGIPPPAAINPRAYPPSSSSSSSASSSASAGGRSSGSRSSSSLSSGPSSSSGNAAFRGTIIERAPPSMLLGGGGIGRGVVERRPPVQQQQSQPADQQPPRKSLFRRQMAGEEWQSPDEI